MRLVLALVRLNDLVFGNQTYRALLATATAGRLGAVAYLSYRAIEPEAGSEKPFDLSSDMIEARWREGANDMTWALERIESMRPGTVTSVRRPARAA
jgi:hypothetical protein